MGLYIEKKRKWNWGKNLSRKNSRKKNLQGRKWPILRLLASVPAWIVTVATSANAWNSVKERKDAVHALWPVWAVTDPLVNATRTNAASKDAAQRIVAMVSYPLFTINTFGYPLFWNSELCLWTIMQLWGSMQRKCCWMLSLRLSRMWWVCLQVWKG